MNEIRFATIGAGFMGSLLTRASCCIANVICAAVGDEQIERAENLADVIGARPYDDVEELFRNERIDAVIVATPELYHLAPVLSAFERGLHVFVEKPISLNLADTDRIIRAGEAAGAHLMVGHILRFESCYANIHSAVVSGMTGRVLSIYARRMAGINEARRLAGRVSPLSYIGVHDIDQVLWCKSEPVTSVTARAVRGRVHEELGASDLAWVTMDFPDGSVAVVEVGWCLPEKWGAWVGPDEWGGFGDVRMSVVGTEGALNLDFTPMGLYGVDRDGWKLPDTRHWPTLNGEPVGAVRLEVEHFFDCVRKNKQPLVTGEDGRKALEVVLAAERSIETGEAVRLPFKG